METDNLRYRNEEELLNHLFWEFILPIPPCIQSDTSIESNEMYWSDYYANLESYQHKVYFQPSLSKPKSSDFKIIDLSDDFNQLYTNLFNDTTLKPRKFIPNPEEVVYKIDLITDFRIDSIHPARFHSDNVLGLFEISRVSFNEDYSKACLLLSATINNECNQLILYFAEKQNNIWTINHKHILIKTYHSQDILVPH
jgi:hypothetical protein